MGAAGQVIVGGSAGAAGQCQRSDADGLRTCRDVGTGDRARAAQHHGLGADTGAHRSRSTKCHSAKCGGSVIGARARKTQGCRGDCASVGSACEGVIAGGSGATGEGERANGHGLRTGRDMRAGYRAGAGEHQGLGTDAGSQCVAGAEGGGSEAGAGIVGARARQADGSRVDGQAVAAVAEDIVGQAVAAGDGDAGCQQIAGAVAVGAGGQGGGGGRAPGNAGQTVTGAPGAAGGGCGQGRVAVAVVAAGVGQADGDGTDRIAEVGVAAIGATAAVKAPCGVAEGPVRVHAAIGGGGTGEVGLGGEVGIAERGALIVGDIGGAHIAIAAGERGVVGAAVEIAGGGARNHLSHQPAQIAVGAVGGAHRARCIAVGDHADAGAGIHDAVVAHQSAGLVGLGRGIAIPGAGADHRTGGVAVADHAVVVTRQSADILRPGDGAAGPAVADGGVLQLPDQATRGAH